MRSYGPAMVEVRRPAAWSRLLLVFVCGTALAAAATLHGGALTSRVVTVVGHLPAAAVHVVAPVAQAASAVPGFDKHKLGGHDAGTGAAAALFLAMLSLAFIRRHRRVPALALAASVVARAPPSTVSD
ncbi:MAG: hypothetical protein QOJ03_1244 [Frankiaceae bacterium]|nr:hypothetical protein [Frankiaceae bacterium]